MRKTTILAILLLPLVFTMPACQTTGINAGQLNLVSNEEEIRLGQNLSGEVEKQQPILNNPALTAYVSDIGMRLVAQTTRRDVPYSFKVIDNDKEINAFALPGGPIYVYTGLLKYADNEAELASVMGHEIAHITARHSTEQLTKAYGYSLIAGIILGEDPGAAAALTRDVVGSLGMLKFSRDDETEADLLGLHYMFDAGYSPNAMTTFLMKLGKLQQERSSRVLNLLSTHPLSQDRVDAVRREISTLPPGRPVGYFSERYQQTISRELK